MKIIIDEVLVNRGLTRYWLWKEIGYGDYMSFCKLCDGETKSISFDKLEKICKVLGCIASDVLVIED